MSNKMLIDATHPEETRVVVLRNGRVEEFDFESAARKLLRGNIYLAKVTRVEPSLQAAFVDYGGNRHGFLAFNEIHPDYYQIPVADRQALLDEEAAAEAEAEAAVDRRAEALARRQERHSQPASPPRERETERDEAPDSDAGDEHIEEVEHEEDVEEIGGDAAVHPGDAHRDTHETSGVADAHASDDDEQDDEDDDAPASSMAATVSGASDTISQAIKDDSAETLARGSSSEAVAETVEETGSPDAMEEVAVRTRRRPRQYKIQEVIKRRQVILVQIVKEERGNKGAALTTYLSLAGRYTVLMPNTARGGGISRKITNPQDRRRLKAIAQELEVPEGMGLIIRTAGAARTKQEIKRDFEYLLRLWESVRELTLQSTAPSLVYEEGDLIKRSIRDLYNKDIEEVVVAGADAHAEAHDFMKMLMPSHARNVVPYTDHVPLFTRHRIENQLNAMFSPQVTLRSGGYIVINQTEALVAIDVNSGKSTREFSIEETALATNLEASDEIARQLKLRDLAGLIVIDFIDMEEKRNNRAVERRLKDALRFDRARIQLGRISHFGLMEMSRQRLRTGVLEGSTTACPHCQATGIIRSTESIALAVLRGIEDAINAGATTPLMITTTSTVALYLLNNKRAYIIEMERHHGQPITINGSDRVQGANFTIERGQAVVAVARRQDHAAVSMDWGFEGDQGADAEAADADEPISNGHANGSGDYPARRDAPNGDEENGQRRGRRRRRRGGGRGGERDDAHSQAGRPQSGDDDEDNGSTGSSVYFVPEDRGPDFAEDVGSGDDEGPEDGEDTPHVQGDAQTEEERRARRGRRRGRRGGRRGRGGDRERSPRSDDQAGTQNFGGASSEQHDFGSVHELGAGGEPGSDVGEPSVPGLGPQPMLGAGPLPVELHDAPSAARPARRPRKPRLWDQPDAANIHAVPAAPVETDAAPAMVPAIVEDVIAPPKQPKREAQPAKPVIAETPSAKEPAPRPRRSTESSEPRIERIVVGTASASSGTEEGTDPVQRKGWWQRRFGAD